jgi:hypothetical protein
MAKRKKRRAPKIVPRLGPATNLRPAGAHKDEKTYDRKKNKATLRREAEDGFDAEKIIPLETRGEVRGTGEDRS